MGEVFGRGIDTAGNFHWHDTDDGHHVYIAQNSGMSNFEIRKSAGNVDITTILCVVQNNALRMAL